MGCCASCKGTTNCQGSAETITFTRDPIAASSVVYAAIVDAYHLSVAVEPFEITDTPPANWNAGIIAVPITAAMSAQLKKGQYQIEVWEFTSEGEYKPRVAGPIIVE